MTEQTTDIFSINEIPVTLTYPSVNVKMTFFMRACLLDEEQTLREQFISMKDSERAEKTHTHNVEMLAELMTRAPEGIASFPVTSDLPGAVRAFFGEATPMKKKIAAEVMTVYYRLSQPMEFFRGF